MREGYLDVKIIRGRERDMCTSMLSVPSGNLPHLLGWNRNLHHTTHPPSRFESVTSPPEHLVLDPLVDDMCCSLYVWITVYKLSIHSE
jgi:hypothetical protein